MLKLTNRSYLLFHGPNVDQEIAVTFNGRTTIRRADQKIPMFSFCSGGNGILANRHNYDANDRVCGVAVVNVVHTI